MGPRAGPAPRLCVGRAASPAPSHGLGVTWQSPLITQRLRSGGGGGGRGRLSLWDLLAEAASVPYVP